MTLVVSKGHMPANAQSIGFGAGGGWKAIIFNAAVDIAQTVITNYLRNRFSGKKTQNSTNKKQSSNKKVRYSTKHYRPRYRPRKYERSRNTRWRKTYRRRGSYN